MTFFNRTTFKGRKLALKSTGFPTFYDVGMSYFQDLEKVCGFQCKNLAENNS